MTWHTKARARWIIVLGCVLLGLLTLLGWSVPAYAAEDTAPPAAADSVAATAEEITYRLQIGDVVSVTVLGESTYSGSFPLRADGSILFTDDMVGAVSLSGLTLEEATQAVTKRIGEYVKDPSVLLTVTRFKVMVVGQVRAPGQYDIEAGTRLAEAIQRAGGVLEARRDLAQIFVTKASGQDLTFNLQSFREQGDDSQNPVIAPGDRISVGRELDSAPTEYRISGAVKKSGYFPIDRDHPVRVTDAIETCERWTQEANPRAAQLIRKDGTKLTIDLTSLDGDPTQEGNVVLQDGDELFVPRNPVQVSVLGGVKNEGQFRVATGTTVLEAIAIAGGLSDNAILRGCVVMRNGLQPERIEVNLEKLMKGGDLSQNPILLDRDIVFVPAKGVNSGKKSVLETVTDNLSRYWWLFRVF